MTSWRANSKPDIRGDRFGERGEAKDVSWFVDGGEAVDAVGEEEKDIFT